MKCNNMITLKKIFSHTIKHKIHNFANLMTSENTISLPVAKWYFLP